MGRPACRRVPVRGGGLQDLGCGDRPSTVHRRSHDERTCLADHHRHRRRPGGPGNHHHRRRTSGAGDRPSLGCAVEDNLADHPSFHHESYRKYRYFVSKPVSKRDRARVWRQHLPSPRTAAQAVHASRWRRASTVHGRATTTQRVGSNRGRRSVATLRCEPDTHVRWNVRTRLGRIFLGPEVQAGHVKLISHIGQTGP